MANPCQYCKKACGSCSWSDNFTPVPGWDATPTVLHPSTEHNQVTETYDIHFCPEYDEDDAPIIEEYKPWLGHKDKIIRKDWNHRRPSDLKPLDIISNDGMAKLCAAVLRQASNDYVNGNDRERSDAFQFFKSGAFEFWTALADIDISGEEILRGLRSREINEALKRLHKHSKRNQRKAEHDGSGGAIYRDACSPQPNRLSDTLR